MPHLARLGPVTLVMALGCTAEPADDPASSAGLALPVDAPGPYSAGHRTLETTYQAPGGVGARTLTVHLWYPTEDTEGERPVYERLFTDTDVVEGASLAPPLHFGRYPVHVYSHGFRGFAGNSADIHRYLATHGWVTVAPDHLGNTLSTHPGTGHAPVPIYFERPLDVRAALDALASLPASDPLAGLVDVDRVVMSGHSFGTYTAWAVAGAAYDLAALRAACASGELHPDGCTEAELEVFATVPLAEPRVVAAIPMAGGGRDDLFGERGYDAARVPFLLLTGSLDDVGAAALFDRVSGPPLTWVDIRGGCHQLFGLGGCPELPDEEGFPVVNTWVLAFARYHRFQDPTPRVRDIVEGRDPVSPLATVRQK